MLIGLTCTSGTVTTTPLNAAEGTPAMFTVSGTIPGTVCTAIESVPFGYTANQADCANVPLGGSCEIINSRNFEVVPALTPRGLAVLALLMLGMGLLGSRRFGRTG